MKSGLKGKSNGEEKETCSQESVSQKTGQICPGHHPFKVPVPEQSGSLLKPFQKGL